MTRDLPLHRRPLVLGLLALALLLGLLVWGLPASRRLESGSTWHRGPSGYSAWYESLEQQGIPVERWQRPVEALLEQLGEPAATPVTRVQNSSANPATLLVVLPGFIGEDSVPALLPWLPQWVEAGHRLVVLGVKTPATAAPFSQTLASGAGAVHIDTRRRYGASSDQQVILEDGYGAVVWRQSLGQGQFVVAATPHLGANAYQAQPGNFAFLTELVAGEGGRVWVDEYLHGYRDMDAIAAETGTDTWIGYLARTPLTILVAQAIAVTAIALLALNRRLGQRRTLPSPSVDNSQAYIQALAGVLHRAGSHDFVVQTLSQAERLHLQKTLGLGKQPLAIDQLQAAWKERSPRLTPDLATVLKPPTPRDDGQLRNWLQRVQSLHDASGTPEMSQETPAGHE